MVADMNIKVGIEHAIEVLRLACIYGDVNVVAAGVVYLTVESNEEQRKALARNNILWSRD